MLGERDIFRLLTGDRDGCFFTDEEADALMAVAGGSVPLAAAMALESMAGERAGEYASVTLMDLSVTEGNASEALMERAARLRQQAAEAPAVGFAQLTVDANSYVDEVVRAVVNGDR